MEFCKVYVNKNLVFLFRLIPLWQNLVYSVTKFKQNKWLKNVFGLLPMIPTQIFSTEQKSSHERTPIGIKFLWHPNGVYMVAMWQTWNFFLPFGHHMEAIWMTWKFCADREQISHLYTKSSTDWKVSICYLCLSFSIEIIKYYTRISMIQVTTKCQQHHKFLFVLYTVN